jgi:serine protease AprX
MTVSVKQKAIHIMIALVLLIGMTGSAVLPRGKAQARAHPMVLELALAEPDQMVSVIAQKADATDRAESLVAQWGGKVTKDLHIINAFAAQLPAGAALELARRPVVRWVSLDAPVEKSGKGNNKSYDDPLPPSYYIDTLNVRPVWEMGFQGQGIGVAVIDSGVTRLKDFQVDPTTGKPESRVVEQLSFNYNAVSNGDVYGHGTHVAGIIGGSGYHSGYLYQGVAPQVNLISLRVSDDNGQAYESDVVDAMQWVYDNVDNKDYNIQVVNLSINSTVTSSYHNSPMSAAAEILWFNGVVVVASVGNKSAGNGNTADASPAHDPFIITVGASNEQETSDRSDDKIGPFSAFGTTYDGFAKPDIYAPGKDIISVLSGAGNWASLYPERVVDDDYFRLSGTSMAAPMVSGAVALLLQAEPELTPDQVKFRLINTAGWVGSGRYLDVYGAVTGTTTESANTGIEASQLLWSGDEPVVWGSVAWNSVAWNSVAWNSVAWNSVAWNSVAWNSVSWNE